MKTISSAFRAACAAFFTLITAGLAAPGNLDSSFNPNVTGGVAGMAVQPDGKILIGGNLGTVGGVTRNGLARINADAAGTLDTAFNPNVNNTVTAIAVQANGQILIGGPFTTVGGVTRNYIARLNADGSLDSGFDPNLDNEVYSIAVQNDGRILIGGRFTTMGGVTRKFIARLNASGSLDSAFDPKLDIAFSGSVSCIALQTDGRIVISGNFATVNGVTQSNLARLNADATGTMDSGFNPTIDQGPFSIAIQANGQILIGGYFNLINGTARSGLARLNADVAGTLDTSFNPKPDSGVETMVVQADGKIIIGGNYIYNVGSPPTPRSCIARIDATGALDTGFNPNVNYSLGNIVLDKDGMILLGGGFSSVGGVTTVGGKPLNAIARLSNDPASQTLSKVDATRVQWLRGGASPETTQVGFELSTDGGVNWTPLGTGTRIAGGWELTALSLPAAGNLRAVASTTGGFRNGSGSFIRTLVAFGAGLSNNANLEFLELPDGPALDPSFDPGTTGYTASVPNAKSSITVTPTVADANATATVKGTPVASGTASGPISLVVGQNSIPVVVTAQDGTTTKTYTVIVTRAGATAGANVNLASLVPSAGTLNPPFANVTTNYTAKVANATTSIAVTATLEDVTSTVKVNGADVASGNASQPIPLRVGPNVITVAVTSQDRTARKTFRLVVLRTRPPTAQTSLANGTALPTVTTAGEVSIRGVAKDDVGVNQVLVSLNGGTPVTANLFPGAKPTDPVKWNLPVAPENGNNTLTVLAMDVSGDFSTPRTVRFHYAVARPELAGTYTGLATPTGAATNAARQVGFGKITVTRTGAFTGTLTLGGARTAIPLSATFGIGGDARFWVNGATTSALEIKRPGVAASLFLGLNLDVTAPLDQQITGRLREGAADGILVSSLTLDQQLFTAAANPAPPLLNVPASVLDPLADKGAYTCIFQSLTPPNGGLAADRYPQGDGWALLKVKPSGAVTVTGKSADGQPVSFGGNLSKDLGVPLYLKLYGETGSVSGPVTFEELPESDANGPGLLWFKPAKPGDSTYPLGWADGIAVNFLGSKYVKPAKPTSANPTPLYVLGTDNILGLSGAPTPAAVEISLADGGTAGFLKPATVDGNNKVTVTGLPDALKLKASLAASSGKVAGSFTHPVSNQTVTFGGVVFQKLNTASGFFLYYAPKIPGQPAPSGVSGGAMIAPRAP